MDAETPALVEALRRTSHPIGRDQRMQAAIRVESEREPGSVQIYPESAREIVPEDPA